MTDHPGKAALAAIMEAAEKATPGSWHSSGWIVSTDDCDDPTLYDAVAVCQGEWSSGTAAFIAIARNNIATVNALVASLEAENKRLREIVSQCAVALGNGAHVSTEATIGFMEQLPVEISLVVAGFRAELAAAKAAANSAVMAERERCAIIATHHDLSLQSTTEADIRARQVAATIRGGGNG